MTPLKSYSSTVQDEARLSTGLPGLDAMLRGLMPGDNVVWQVERIEDYVPFVKPFCAQALKSGRKLSYFRFAKHDPLIEKDSGGQIHELDPEEGFETFLGHIHTAIEKAGRGAFFVFDCLSDLSADWYSDRMVGNFFKLTCPFLYDLETITYFALLRGAHAVYATEPITETTQLLLDVYSHHGRLYVHPLKVQHRYSPTMHMLHVWKGEQFVPVSESYIIAEVLASTPAASPGTSRSRLGIWRRTFLEAEELLDSVPDGWRIPEESKSLLHRLLRMVISRDERVLRLAAKYLNLRDLVEIGRRMVGTGLIGGKSVGMLLARAILRNAHQRLASLLEVHDSFFIGSDVFYTYLVHNGCWWMRQEQKNPSAFLGGADRARQRILTGVFPAYLERQFADILDYFGQSPIIVRSSSLLEDNFGNAFAGQYESIFCVNQGSREKRLQDFMSAVKTVYASSMSERALTYRARRNLLECDEQMALLVQRVSGAAHGSFFYPHVAGVGYSFNMYKWSDYIDPEAGMLRLVFGLGTRAVDRSDDDYTRVVALNAPERRPESTFDKVRKYAQRKVDVLDLEGNLLVPVDFTDVSRQCPGVPLSLLASRDEELERRARERGRKEAASWVLTFDELISKTSFIEDMREMLHVLQEAYEYPVDVEFTANFLDDGNYRINLLQCRPLQVKTTTALSEPRTDILDEDLLIKTQGPVIGPSKVAQVDRLVYVVPAVYGQLPIAERYRIARLIGQVMHLDRPYRPETIALFGPGRWGTTTPSLGVPVSFNEINTVSILCEIVAMRDDLVPDVSLGTHFLSELVEMDILYLAIFPHHEGNVLNTALFDRATNRLPEYLPQAAAYSHVVKVIDVADLNAGRPLKFNADTLKQRVVCYFDS